MRVVVLGSAAGGGFPQWNCRCPVCQLAWQGDPRVSARTQSSLAVSADGESWVLLNASPDLRQQIIRNVQLHPSVNARHTPIRAVVLTNGDVDHIAGLLTLREGQPFTLHASASILETLADNPIFRVVNPSVVTRSAFQLDQAFEVAGLRIVAFAVPGKVPLFLEGDDVEIGMETETTVGLEITHGGGRLIYAPGCASVNAALLDRVAGADVLFFDGTTYTDDEMPALRLSTKTAARMGHLAMDGRGGSIASFADVDVKRKIFIHINNTNPVLIEGSRARHRVEAAGWEVGHDGMEVSL